ncbi:MAG TPA: guanylate kinase [Burkholderiales bacterium]|nr:guanylate kinase [Burkholderiales bacterium]
MKGLLFVVTAPSGAGKTSLINAVLAQDSRLRLSVSYTTRPPRPAEQNGREYHFVDDATFVAMLERGEFLESAQVHGHRYGTSQATVAGALEGGHDLVLEIDWQGAQQVRRLIPQCIGIFLLPPSLPELERRLRARGQDSEPVITRRMAAAQDEISHAPESDYVIFNKDFEVARRDMLAIIRAERLTTERQLARIGELF